MGKVPGGIVIMEAFGVNKHSQKVADKLPTEGYEAVAPVLYHRVGSNPIIRLPRRQSRLSLR